MMQPTRVAVVRVRDDIAGAVRRGIDLMGGMGRYVRQYGLDGSICDLNHRRPRPRLKNRRAKHGWGTWNWSELAYLRREPGDRLEGRGQ